MYTVDVLLDSGMIPLSLLNQLTRLDEHRGRESLFRAQRAEALEQLVKVALIQSTTASNAIEGITAPPARIKALVEERTAPANRSEAEIAGYRSALDLIHAHHEHMSLSDTVTLQLHKTMLEFTGDDTRGRYKSVDNAIEEVHTDGTRTVRFEPTPAWQTPEAMCDLHERTSRALQQRDLHPALVIGAFVLDFTCIHPFLDGNGRLSRLLTLLGLYRSGYSVGRYVSIERVIAESKDTYYSALQSANDGWASGAHDPYRWLDYFIGVLLVAYDRFEANMETLNTYRGSKADAIMSFVRGRAIAGFTMADVREAVPTASDQHIRRVLHRLRDAGEIKSTGTGRSAAWRLLG
jgi:Fic family protein